MPVVVSHLADDLDALARQVRRQEPLADLVELRLDRIGTPGEDELRSVLGSIRKPKIVACPGPEAHGFFEGSDDERLDLLALAARSGAQFVDVDWTLSLALGEVEGKCHRIVSRHDPEGTPEDLEAFHEEVRELLYEGDLVKLVPHARSTEDGLRVLRHVRASGGGLVGFASGERGSFTRVLAPIFDSPFTYASPARIPGEPEPPATAPGQIPVNELRALFPPGGVSDRTAVFGVVGRPVAGSLSPHVLGMALRAKRLDAVYVAFEPDDFAAFFELADDEHFRGFSVTAPFKRDAWERVRRRDGASESAGACNTLVREADGWRAANTDVPAVRDTLSSAIAMHAAEPGRPGAIAEAHTLVLGTGGAARAAAWAVRSLEGRVTIAGRDEARARALAGEIGGEGIAWDRVGELRYDVLVHATPVGSLADPDRLPIPEDAIRPGTLVLDAVYRPVRTPLLVEAKARGCTAVPGGEWFVRQAREQLRAFTREEPDDALLRAAFEHAIAGERGGGRGAPPGPPAGGS